MSILRVANLQFNASGTKRIDYDAVVDDGIIKISADAVRFPVGDNGTRPPSQPGLIRYNSDVGYMEFGGPTKWIQVASNSVYDVANLAFASANASSNTANSFGNQIAVSYNTTNVAYASINSNWTVTNTVYGVANAAFASANNVGPQLAPAYNTANAAFGVANTALANTNGVTLAGALNIPGNLKVYRGVNAGGTFNLGDGTSAWTFIGNQINGGDLLFKDPSNNTVMYYSQSGGSVGIGNTTPGPAKVHITSANTIGGIGYADFLRVTNASYPAITNPVKTFRLNQTGGIEVINNAYTAVIMQLDDSGNLTAAFPGLFQSTTNATTSADRSLGYSTSWTDHLSVTFTATKAGPIYAGMVLAMTYESAAVQGEAQFVLSGAASKTSQYMAVAQQSDANRARGAHSMTWMFGNCPAGSYTLTLQVRNNGSGSTWILNNYLGFDTLYCSYM